MSDIAYIDSILDGVIDFKSPLASLAVLNKFRNSLTLLQGILEDKSSLILEGTLDADPPNQMSSFITDANPSAGAIDRNDKFNGITLELTSGAAIGEYVITDTDAGLDRIVVLENLGALGALTGDTYVLRGHSHNGADSEFVEIEDVIGLGGLTGLPVDTVAWFESSSCPTGWVPATGSEGHFYKGGPTTGSAGVATHNHTAGSITLADVGTGGLFRIDINALVAGAIDWTPDIRGRHDHTGGGAGSYVPDDLDLSFVGLKPCKIL